MPVPVEQSDATTESFLRSVESGTEARHPSSDVNRSGKDPSTLLDIEIQLVFNVQIAALIDYCYI